MTLPATADRGGGIAAGESVGDEGTVAFDHFGQAIVQRTEDAGSLRVVGSGKLRDFQRVALAAVFGRHDGGDELPKMLERVQLSLDGLVAFIAADARLKVAAFAPLLINSGVAFLVALDTLDGGI